MLSPIKPRPDVPGDEERYFNDLVAAENDPTAFNADSRPRPPMAVQQIVPAPEPHPEAVQERATESAPAPMAAPVPVPSVPKKSRGRV